MPFAFILAPDPAFHQPILDQRAQHPVKRLFRHAENGQQVIHRGAGRAVDEMQRPVMRAPVFLAFQNPVRVGGKAAISEKHRLDSLAQLLVRQKQQALATPRSRSALRHRAVLSHHKFFALC
ncbi:hypothetical protein GALL_543830 [mine drainage metagenome]|uniref:Uncharacterized protein n=1 Tax=mine drainage metagenome TaxID=410659 RepID=A0A1J5PKL1_9ZZZZ